QECLRSYSLIDSVKPALFNVGLKWRERRFLCISGPPSSVAKTKSRLFYFCPAFCLFSALLRRLLPRLAAVVRGNGMVRRLRAVLGSQKYQPPPFLRHTSVL